jgi:3D (Asp-Asp-Asp) domain-containing protein
MSDLFANIPVLDESGQPVAAPVPSNAVPVTQYSIPKRVLGGKQGDELYDSGTARGVGSSENELAPGIVAVNPSVHPIGTIFKDADTNEVFIAGDKHGNKNPNLVDIYTPPSQYSAFSGQRNLIPIDQIPTNRIPKTANGVSELLSNYGKVPQGEGAYTSLGKTTKSSNLFANIPVIESAPTPSPTPEQTGETINLPATPSKEQNVFDKALEQYPKLKDANAVGIMSTNTQDGANMLESWPAGETGTPERPRPKELPQDKLGVQIFNQKTTPDDVAADIVSHSLVKTDPNLKATYDQFASSLTPEQTDFLKGDYENAVKNEGETRPFDQWMQTTGIPSAFRGYAFGQYDQKAQQEFGYTDQQKQVLGSVKPYLQGEQQEKVSPEAPYDYKGAAIAAASTIAEQAPGLYAGEYVARPVATALTGVGGPIAGGAGAMVTMLGTQAGVAYGVQQLENLVGIRQQIEEAQQSHPNITHVTADVVLAPMAIKSLYNMGTTFAKTMDEEGAKAAATQIAKTITGGAAGGTLMAPIRYGLEYLGYQTGITKEKPKPITTSEELEGVIIGAIISKYHQEKDLQKKTGGLEPKVAPSPNPSVNQKQQQIENMAGQLSEGTDKVISLPAIETPPKQEPSVAEPAPQAVSGAGGTPAVEPTAEAPAKAQPTISNATQTREIKQDNQPEHKEGNQSGEATETSGGNRIVEGGKEPQKEVGQNLLPEDRALISGLAKQEQDKINSGVGGASPEEFMQRYAIIGANAIMDGHASLGAFATEISKQIPSMDKDLIPEVYKRAGDLINEFETANGGKTPVEKKPTEKSLTVTVNPRTALKQSLKAQEKAGEAGYKRGVKETKAEANKIISDLKAKIDNSITKAQALAEYLRGQQTGSQRAKADTLRQIKSADKILSLNQEDIRRDMTDLSKKMLPPSERGRFIGAITRALKRPNILTGDPMTMYKNAENVMTAMKARSAELYRIGVMDEIKTTADRALKSPSVDLQFKNLIRKALQDVNLKSLSGQRISDLKSTREYLNRMEAEGKNVFIPQQIINAIDQLGKTPIKDLPVETLENLNTRLKLIEKLGRMKFKNRQAAQEAEIKIMNDEIMSGDGTPLETRPEFKPQPGEKITIQQRFGNALARFYNATNSFDIGHLPQDVIFDWIQGKKGTYSGPLFDHIRTPMDAAYDSVQRATISAVNPLKEIIKKYKLSNQDEEMIGLYAQLKQEGGEQAALEAGVDPKIINSLKASGLSNGQKVAYDYMRKVLDNTLPRIQETMHNLYNVPVEAVENYFPWMRDFEKYKADPNNPIFDATTGKPISQEELDSYSNLVGNLQRRNTSKTPQGFTIERKKGANPAIRYDAFDVFQRHMYNANRLIELQPTARNANKLINSEEFGRKFGQYGQQLLQEWLTASVTDGQGNNTHRWELLDNARQASSKGLVFFNLVSNIKHASAIPQGFANAGGPSYWWKGTHLQHTPEGLAFLENFPQITQRGAGEQSFQELQKNLMKDPEGIYAKTMSIGERYGFILGKAVDELNSRSVFIGRYLKNLEDKGLPATLQGEINQDAAYNAMAYMRRTVSSTLPKDIQPTLGRGAGFGGNVSLARTMNAFKQFALERWSLMRYDIPTAFQQGNYTKAGGTVLCVLLASLYETQLPGVVKGISEGVFGKDPNKKEEHETWYQKLALDTLMMLPYVSSIASVALYKDAGIPVVDVARNVVMSGYGAATSKTEQGQKKNLINAVTAAAEVKGVPGAAVAGKFAKQLFLNPERAKQESAEVAKETRKQKALEGKGSLIKTIK